MTIGSNTFTDLASAATDVATGQADLAKAQAASRPMTNSGVGYPTPALREHVFLRADGRQ
jgi:hypothetical protein